MSLGDFAIRLARAKQILVTEGVGSLLLRLARIPHNSYGRWIRLFDRITADDRRRMRSLAGRFAHRPRISIAMPTYNPPDAYLRAAIESVLAQTYDDWELCIADDASTDPQVRATLAAYAARDDRIKLALRAENGHISRATNSALEIASGEWVTFLDHDDVLAPHALFALVAALNEHPNARIIYSDEDKLDAAGNRWGHYFKPDWNLELFRSHDLMTHLVAYRRGLIDDLGRLRVGYEGAQDYDLALRAIERVEPQQIVHAPLVLYHWRAAEGSTAKSNTEKPYAMQAGLRALQEHLDRTGARATAELIGFGYRIHYALPDPPPLVSLLILTRNRRDLLERCIASIRNKSTYANYEIVVVDNGSDEPAALEYLGQIEATDGIRVLRDQRPFNYSALNNLGVSAARGSVLVLLNNDIEVITPGWLEELVGLALQPGVGAVGAKLLYPNDTLQHAGLVVGIRGLAGHVHLGLPRSSPGYNGRAALVSDFSAVTGACLAVTRENYLAVGGLDEEAFAVAFNDVDFCLRLRARGLRNVWTPFAELYHRESATRGPEDSAAKQARFEREAERLREKWSSVIAADPAYNPNLSLYRSDFALAFPPRVRRPWRE